MQPKLLRDTTAVFTVLMEHVGPIAEVEGREVRTLFSHAVLDAEKIASILHGNAAAAHDAIVSDRPRLCPSTSAVLFRGLKKVRTQTIASALTVQAKKISRVALVKAQFETFCRFVTLSSRLPQPLPLWQLLQYELLKYPPALFLEDGNLRSTKKSDFSRFCFHQPLNIRQRLQHLQASMRMAACSYSQWTYPC